jgi:tRNA/rRNA methyltransferase
MSNKPIIILSHPQMGENIGAVARVMTNFGLDELRLINPRDGWPSAKATMLAVNSEHILAQAKVFASFNEAVADINYLCATSGYMRQMVKKFRKPREAISEIANFAGKVGFLFGCERSGLTNEEINLCDMIIGIPTSLENQSLNLSHAVAIICYEYFAINISEHMAAVELASKEELNFLIERLLHNLKEKNFFKNLKMIPEMRKNIVNIFVRAELTSQDTRTMLGIFRALNDGNL